MRRSISKVDSLCILLTGHLGQTDKKIVEKNDDAFFEYSKTALELYLTFVFDFLRCGYYALEKDGYLSKHSISNKFGK